MFEQARNTDFTEAAFDIADSFRAVGPASALLAVLIVMIYAVQWYWGATDIFLPLMGSTHPGTFSRGHVWTLASSTLVHAGLLHVGMNALFLLLVGSRVERVYGSWRMVVIFFVGALAGSVLSVALNPNQFGVGASGGAWALMVAELISIVAPKTRRGQPALSTWQQALMLVGLNVAVSFIPGVDAVAHVAGGLAGGLTILVLYRLPTAAWALAAVGLLVAHAVSVALALWMGQPWNGWPALGPDVKHTFGESGVVAVIPSSLPIFDNTREWRAGDIWYEGMAVWLSVATKSQMEQAFLEVTRHWGLSLWEYVDCSPGAVCRVAQYAGGHAYVSNQADGEYELITMVFVHGDGSSERDAWAREHWVSARYSDADLEVSRLWMRHQQDPDTLRRAISELLHRHPDHVWAWNIAAWNAATDPTGPVRDGRWAVELAEHAVALQPQDAALLDTLAAAHAANDDFEAAMLAMDRAIALSSPEYLGILMDHRERLEQGQRIEAD